MKKAVFAAVVALIILGGAILLFSTQRDNSPSEEVTLRGKLVEAEKRYPDPFEVFSKDEKVYYVKFETHNRYGDQLHYSYYASLAASPEPYLNKKVILHYRYKRGITGKIVEVEGMGPAIYGTLGKINMNYRKSLIKVKGGFNHPVTKEDFIKYAGWFSEIFSEVCGPSVTRIELYARVPYFSSHPLSGKEKARLKGFNERGMRILTDLSELPENFAEIPYVRVILDPKSESTAPQYAFGVVDFGTLLPSHIIFYAQPEEVAEKMEEFLFLGDEAPEGFKLGDGFEWNTNQHVPPSTFFRLSGSH